LLHQQNSNKESGGAAGTMPVLVLHYLPALCVLLMLLNIAFCVSISTSTDQSVRKVSY
jgi:hypothetical protein